MDDIKPPNTWRRPRSKVYDYNQKFGGNYYQPMIDYIDTKDRQGVFFERPTERIQLPDPVEVVCSDKYKKSCEDAGGDHNVARYLTKAYAQQIKEQNMSTVRTQTALLHASTEASKLTPRLTAGMLRDHYTQEIKLLSLNHTD